MIGTQETHLDWRSFIVGNPVRFTYNGKERNGEVVATYENRVTLTLEDGSYKSFLYSKITGLRACPHCDDSCRDNIDREPVNGDVRRFW